MAIETAVAGESEADLARYLELLRLESPDSGDEDELRDLMTRLNKTPEQVAIDAGVLRRVDALDPAVTSGLTSAVETAGQGVEAVDIETQSQIDALRATQLAAMNALIATRDAARDTAVDTQNAAYAALKAGREAVEGLNALKRNNPALLKASPARSLSELD